MCPRSPCPVPLMPSHTPLSDDRHELLRATDVKNTHLSFTTRQSPFLWAVKQERPSAKTHTASEPELGALVQRSFPPTQKTDLHVQLRLPQGEDTDKNALLGRAAMHIPASHNLWNDTKMASGLL